MRGEGGGHEQKETVSFFVCVETLCTVPYRCTTRLRHIKVHVLYTDITYGLPNVQSIIVVHCIIVFYDNKIVEYLRIKEEFV